MSYFMNLTKYDTLFQVTDWGMDYEDKGNYYLMFLSFVFTMAVLARLLFGSFIPIFFFPFMLLCGLGFGILMYNFEVFIYFNGISNLPFSVILALFGPIILFHAAYGIDYHSLGHNMAHILLMSIPGIILHCVVVTLLSYPVMNSSHGWPLDSVFGFSVLLAPVQAESTIQDLNGAQGQVRPLQLLLQGEQLITLTISMFLHVYLMKLSLLGIKTVSGMLLLKCVCFICGVHQPCFSSKK